MAKITNRTINQLTDVALSKGWEDNQLYRQEARDFTENYMKKFGIFVGLYNKLNGSSLSVEQALFQSELLTKFQTVSNLLSDSNTTVTQTKSQPKKLNGKAKSTKRLSYEQFQVENGTSVAHAIYYWLRNHTDGLYSRSDIAKGVGIRLSTVCGQIPLLEEAGLVYISGTKIDPDSNRMVETIVAR